LSPAQKQGADVLQQLVGTDAKTAESLASRLTPEELKALGDLAATSGKFSQVIGQKGGSKTTRSGGGGRGGQGVAGNRPSLDPEAWEKFLNQIRNNPAAQHELLKKYPELQEEMNQLAGGGAPSQELQARLEEEFIRSQGPMESLPQTEQKKYQDLGKKLGLNEQELNQVLSGKTLSEKQLGNLARKTQQSEGKRGPGEGSPTFGEGSNGGAAAGAAKGGGPSSLEQGGGGKGQKGGQGPQARGSKNGNLPSLPPLTREQRQEKARLKVEQALKFLENAAVAFLYLAAVYLLYILFVKFSDRQKDETKPVGRLNRDDRKSLASELRQMRARPLSPQEEVVKSYHLFLRVMEMVQYPRAQEVTPTNFAQEVVRHFPRLRDPVPYVSEVFCQVFYGKREVESGTLEQFRGHFKKVFRQFGLR
ncbi:MAG: DUF4129 domain-containing protein, partial [Bdellovibrionales bacterium]|nr:DUF4129 domain-containing protein [Bdellovibrionales bacterium]